MTIPLDPSLSLKQLHLTLPPIEIYSLKSFGIILKFSEVVYWGHVSPHAPPVLAPLQGCAI